MLYNIIESQLNVEMNIGNFSFKKDGLDYILMEGEKRWMTYTPTTKSQMFDFTVAYDLAYGDCILSGLGMGILPTMLSKKPTVNNIIVYEKSCEVIEMNLRCGMIDKVTIVNQPIQHIKQSNADCLFMDHFETETFDEIVSDMRNIVNQNNVKVVWFWSFEHTFIKRHGDIMLNDYKKSI